MRLGDAGIIKGFSDGTFGGEQKLTRQQAATMITNMLKYTGMDTKVTDKVDFKDIDKISTSAQDSVKFLASKGVLVNGEDVNFNPYNNITRAQTAKMIYRLLVKNGYKDQVNAVMSFSDVPTTDAELNKAAAQLKALGIMTGSNGKLNPNEPLTRDQMAKVLNNALQALEGLK